MSDHSGVMETGYLVWSPSDLVDFVACEHLAVLDRQVATGDREAPALGPEAELVFARGRDHEAAVVARLAGSGADVVELPYPASAAARLDAARATVEAMRAGAAVIHNATFVDGDFHGIADLLIRVEEVSDLGAWRYEPADAKLARTAQPSAILQLCAYAERVTAIQGVAPRHIHLYLGTEKREAFALAEFAAYYRTVRDRFLTAMRSDRDPYPEPVAHCARCRWDAACTARRETDDHLSRVAMIRRDQYRKLEAASIGTMRALAALPPETRVPHLADATLDRLRQQARLQCAMRETGKAAFAFRAREPRRGFELLPARDPGDVAFDMEGDPFYDKDGLEYLFGVSYVEEGVRQFQAFWGHNRADERVALESFIDFVVERRARYPQMHVYHYAPYETTAITRLAGRFATREAELDDLLRSDVFVDLFAVVRQALVLSTDSYSIKSVEQFYRAARTGDVKTAIGSVLEYESWRRSGDRRLLDNIERYNRDDCESTLDLLAWLHAIDPGASTTPVIEATAPPKPPSEEELTERALAEQLGAGTSEPPEEPVSRRRWLTGHLLGYHRREARPDWRAFFTRRDDATADELLDDPEALAHLTHDGAEPTIERASEIFTLRMPPQECKLRAGKSLLDPALRRSLEVVALDRERGVVAVKRAKTRRAEPLPAVLIANGPVANPQIRRALRVVAREETSSGERFRAVRDLISGARPRLRSGGAMVSHDDMRVDEIAALAADLDESCLVIQGPPGTGKTYTGARVALALLQAGLTVGVTARAHKAIHHLVAAIERAAAEAGSMLRGAVKVNAENPYVAQSAGVEAGDMNLEAARANGATLLAGTAWAFAREPFQDDPIDVLIVDEAGQFALADAVAAGASARNLLLLGDPQQLAQVRKGTHPPLVGASVLEHVLGDDATIPADRGVFLPRTYRMHPEVCDFVSTLMYDGRLTSAPGCEQQCVAGFAGLRMIDVVHDGNKHESREEAEAITSEITRLIGRPYTDAKGIVRSLTPADILVVAPYNAQVRRIGTTLAGAGLGGVAVGTVDKFQGQEAPVVFFSLTASSGEEITRGIDFLFSQNRLNVAISRARALAYLVASPQLLALRAGDLDDMRLVNAVALFRERAMRVDKRPA